MITSNSITHLQLCRLAFSINWQEDEIRTEELYYEMGDDTSDAHVYVAIDTEADKEMVFKTWAHDTHFVIQVEADER
jgi:hypothetical protein